MNQVARACIARATDRLNPVRKLGRQTPAMFGEHVRQTHHGEFNDQLGSEGAKRYSC